MITVQISADVEIPAIGEDVHLICSFRLLNEIANIFIAKDNLTSLARKICFKDGDCKEIVSNDSNDASKLTWMTDNTPANLTIKEWGMSDNGDYRCIVDDIGSNTVKLDVLLPGPPDTPEIDGINLIDGEEANVNCKSNNGYPAPLTHWYMQSTNLTNDSSLHVITNRKGRVDATSSLVFTPSRYDHGKRLICQVFRPTAPSIASQNYTKVLDILYSPFIVDISARRLENEKRFISIEFICTSDANPPAINFNWYHNRTILTNTSRHLILSGRVQMKTISTSRLLIYDVQPSDYGKYECLASTDLGNATATLNYTVIPDPPSGVFVDQNQTTSSTLIVAWQPGFDGGLQQTFTLEYCPNDMQVEKEGCGYVVTNLTGTSYTLVGLKPFTWYKMTLWAVNSAGSSSAVEVVASTAPLPPDSYGVIVTLDRENHVLTFSMANQSLEGICFIIIPKTKEGNDCSFVNETECIAASTTVSIDPEDDLIVVTYGRALCGDPAHIIDLPEEKEPPSLTKSPPFMTIAIGVISSAGFLILISVALLYFYRKKLRRTTESTTSTAFPPVATTKLQPEQVSQEVYAEISSTEDHKSESPKSTKGFYMDMKPIIPSQSAISSCKPSGSSTDDYVSPSFTMIEHEPEYASADDPTYASAILRMTGNVDDDDDDDDDGDGVATTCMYMEIDPNVPVESCSHGSKRSGPDIKGYFSPITKPRKNGDHVDRAEAVYTNTESDKAPQGANRDPKYANTAPFTADGGDVTTTYMEINPEMASEFCSNGSKPSTSNKECLSPSFERMKNADQVERAEGVYVNTEITCEKEPDDSHYINTVPMATNDDDDDDDTAAYIEIKP